jgi:hypothetical protein
MSSKNAVYLTVAIWFTAVKKEIVQCHGHAKEDEKRKKLKYHGPCL